jgi:hypothetical protein
VAANRPRPTLADYVTIALSPALIVAMIVSVVFFLAGVLYRGEYVTRLHWILFFFIFGIVLVARIAIAGIAERAPLYGAILAALTWLGLGKLVDYPEEIATASWLINAGLIALAWWLAHQLTHSCTYIDEKAESTGAGVLQAAGLEAGGLEAPTQTPTEAPDTPPQNGKRAKKRQAKTTWWQRYQRYREARKKTQPPGVWVVYFGLAALPIFGLGQALIDVEDMGRRARGFALMVLYAASALGLLVTTAFLGLRRYLRQRRLEMPRRVTAAWLTLGGVLLTAFVGVSAALPRPQAEFSFVLARAGSKKAPASKYALSQGEPGKGPGRAGAQEHDPKASAAGKQGRGSGAKDGQGQAAAKGKDAAEQGSQRGGKGTQKDSAQNAEAKQETQQQGKGQGDAPDSGDRAQGSDSPANSSWIQELYAQLVSLLKWILFGILITTTVLFVLAGGLRYLANFCDWASRLLDALRRFWEGLFGQPRRTRSHAHEEEERLEPAGVPFSSFMNPFLTGRADSAPAGEVVRYSFEALEAWARENDCGRGRDETPIEFTKRLAVAIGALDSETTALGDLYARVLYGGGRLPGDWRDTLEEFWRRLAALPARRLAHEAAEVA